MTRADGNAAVPTHVTVAAEGRIGAAAAVDEATGGR